MNSLAGQEENKLGTLAKGPHATGVEMVKGGNAPICTHSILAKSPWNRPVDLLLTRSCLSNPPLLLSLYSQ